MCWRFWHWRVQQRKNCTPYHKVELNFRPVLHLSLQARIFKWTCNGSCLHLLLRGDIPQYVHARSVNCLITPMFSLLLFPFCVHPLMPRKPISITHLLCTDPLCFSPSFLPPSWDKDRLANWAAAMGKGGKKVKRKGWGKKEFTNCRTFNTRKSIFLNICDNKNLN